MYLLIYLFHFVNTFTRNNNNNLILFTFHRVSLVPGATYCFGDLPLTSSDDSSSRGFLGLLVRLVISAVFKEKGSFSRIWSSERQDGGQMPIVTELSQQSSHYNA